jgi:hypothetical protein
MPNPKMSHDHLDHLILFCTSHTAFRRITNQPSGCVRGPYQRISKLVTPSRRQERTRTVLRGTQNTTNRVVMRVVSSAANMSIRPSIHRFVRSVHIRSTYGTSCTRDEHVADMCQTLIALDICIRLVRYTRKVWRLAIEVLLTSPLRVLVLMSFLFRLLLHFSLE